MHLNVIDWILIALALSGIAAYYAHERRARRLLITATRAAPSPPRPPVVRLTPEVVSAPEALPAPDAGARLLPPKASAPVDPNASDDRS